MRVQAGDLVGSIEDGVMRVGFGEPDWLGPMTTLGGPALTSASVEDGAFIWNVEAADDRLLTLTLATTAPVSGRATGEFDAPSVGWTWTPADRTPGGVPDGTRGAGHQYTEFALPTRSGPDLDRWSLLEFRPAVVEPLLLVAPDRRTLLVAPLDSFHDQVIAVPTTQGGAVRAGWHGDLDDVPAGFTTTLAVLAGDGPRTVIERWLGLLRDGGPDRPGAAADVLGERLSYWTDNGAAYWYRSAPDLDVPTTLEAAVGSVIDAGLTVGSVQLDSWFYPHQTVRPFDTDEWVVPPTGLVTWDARHDILPEGIAELRRRLGDLPLVTHCRHLSSSSPYVEQFECWVDEDRAHPKGDDYYGALLERARSWGVDVFEHDWLIECFLGVRGFRGTPGAAALWQRGIDREAAARGMTLQWCMASPADFMATAQLRSVTSIRTSGDHGYLVGPGFLWQWFLMTNVLARALGLWPFKDVFRTDDDPRLGAIDALLAALSGGPVGIGDRIGETAADVVRRTCRADGVIVRPDVPVAATDGCYGSDAVLGRQLTVAECFTDHGQHRWVYAVAVAHRDGATDPVAAEVSLGELGVAPVGQVFVWNWFEQTGMVEPAAGSVRFEAEPVDVDYRVIAPILGDEVAVVGDLDRYATAGRRRIDHLAVSPGGGISFVVMGANETVRLGGWSRTRLDGTDWDPATGVWTVQVELGADGWRPVSLDPA